MPHIRHLYYEETGEGHPVILIHCPGANHALWRPVMARLRTACRCMAVDVRGHGRSGLGDAPWSFPDIAADLAMLVRRLELSPPPILAGFSAGGCIALQAALDEPELYGGLALIGSFSECTSLYLRNKVRLGLLANRAGLTRQVVQAVLAVNNTGSTHLASMREAGFGVRPQSLHSFLRAAMRAGFTAHLGEIRRPVLLIYGTGDEPMHPYYRILRQGLPASRAAFIQGCDHHVPTKYPVALADLLAEFVGDLVTARADPLLLPSFQHPGVDLRPFDGPR